MNVSAYTVLSRSPALNMYADSGLPVPMLPCSEYHRYSFFTPDCRTMPRLLTPIDPGICSLRHGLGGRRAEAEGVNHIEEK